MGRGGDVGQGSKMLGRGRRCWRGPAFVSLFCDFVFSDTPLADESRKSVSFFGVSLFSDTRIPAFEANVCPFFENLHFSDTKMSVQCRKSVSFFGLFFIFGHKNRHFSELSVSFFFVSSFSDTNYHPTMQNCILFLSIPDFRTQNRDDLIQTCVPFFLCFVNLGYNLLKVMFVHS